MCPNAGRPAKTTALPLRCLLSSGSRGRILPGAQVIPDDVGEWHGALACPGLGRTEGGPAAELLDQLPVDPDRTTAPG